MSLVQPDNAMKLRSFMIQRHGLNAASGDKLLSACRYEDFDLEDFMDEEKSMIDDLDYCLLLDPATLKQAQQMGQGNKKQRKKK